MTRLLQLLLTVALSAQVATLSIMAPALAGERPAQVNGLSTEAIEGENRGATAQGGAMKEPSEKNVEVTPKRRFEFVYGLTLFTGDQYQETFCPEEIGTMYMIAGVDNVITASRTNVYFWPITREYMADWMEMNERQEGVLEILRGKSVIKALPLEMYTLRCPDGIMGKVAGLVTGEQAKDATEQYEALMDSYYKELMAYYREYSEYRELLTRFWKNPKAFAGNPPIEPEQPSPPKEYFTEINRGFVVNLPPGNYEVRFRDGDGKVTRGSERRLVAFPVLAEGTGYQIVPEDRWTHPTNSSDPSENIFALRGQTIYVKPFREFQYNSHHYTKLTKLTAPSSGRGTENQKTWVHVSSLSHKDLTIEITKGGEVLGKIEERLYCVRQRPGYALGYDIVELAGGGNPEESPSFTAYKIEMPTDSGSYGLRLVDEDGKAIGGSFRTLRIARQPGLAVLMLASLVPLAAGVLVAGTRAAFTGRFLSKVKQP